MEAARKQGMNSFGGYEQNLMIESPQVTTFSVLENKEPIDFHGRIGGHIALPGKKRFLRQ
jgi:hypothetical protein